MKINFPKIQIMKQTSLNAFNYSRQISFGSEIRDSVEFSPKTKKNSELLKPFYSSKKRFSAKDYEKLSDSEVSKIKDLCPDSIKDVVDDNVILGSKFKESLDEKYGKDGYIFVSIGTSPALLAKFFEFSGVETKYLPISNLENASYDKKLIKKEFDNYRQFLSQQGIDKKQLEKGNKKAIFYDYTHTGLSLNRFKDLMMNELCLPSDKVEFRSLNKDIEDSVKSVKGQFIEDIYVNFAKFYIKEYFIKANAEEYAGVPHLNWCNLQEIRKGNEENTPKSQMYNFLLIDKLKNDKLLKNSSLKTSSFEFAN